MNDLITMASENISEVYFILLCLLLGIEIISNVPSILHTPLMSGSNAISGVVVMGSIMVMGQLENDDYLPMVIGGIAVFLGGLNISGGFYVTSRMLKLFRAKNQNK